MSEIACTATMSSEAIELDLDGSDISISLEGDIDFTALVKHLTNLIERKANIEITWTESEGATDKGNVAKEVIDKIIDSFNQVIEEEFDERDEGDEGNPF
jgi:hypothetical protein